MNSSRLTNRIGLCEIIYLFDSRIWLHKNNTGGYIIADSSCVLKDAVILYLLEFVCMFVFVFLGQFIHFKNCSFNYNTNCQVL